MKSKMATTPGLSFIIGPKGKMNNTIETTNTICTQTVLEW